MTSLGPTESVLDAERESPPQKVAIGAFDWMRKHLFSSVFNTTLTVIALLIAVFVTRGIAGFIFGDRPKWGSVTENMRLYMTFGYPPEQIFRVWLSVGIVFALFGLTLAAWGGGNRVSANRLASSVTKLGGTLVALALVTGPFPILWDDAPLSLRAEIIMVVIGFALGGLAMFHKARTEEQPERTISRTGILAGSVVFFIAFIWLLQVPTPMLDADGVYSEPLAPLATTTTWPWTLMAVIMMVFFLLGGVFVDRRGEERLRSVLVASWLFSYPLIVFVILRAPDIDWNQFWTRDIWIVLGFVVGGGLLLLLVADPERPERGRILSLGTVVLAIAMFWPLSIGGLPRNLMIVTAIYMLVAPSFAAKGAMKRTLANWVAVVLIASFFMIAMDTEMILQISKESFLGGLALTIILALGALGLAFPLAILVALGRQSRMPIFRQLSIGYVELIRGVPLIVWLIMAIGLFGFFVPTGVELDKVIRVLVAFTIFWAAYLAENIRGGLQAVGKGQTEAAEALGMTAFQTTTLIVLPQALRLVIPPIVGQVITSFKDTSLVAIVGVFELLNIAIRSIPAQTVPTSNFTFIGTVSENLLFVAMVYWVFTYTMSRSSLRLEEKLGVGKR
ncbi:MAG: amino acid ABC transporter permease [Actinomycetota bacterium]|nr:amino acid ABC transporter permease [Actinomycetota bacterium]